MSARPTQPIKLQLRELAQLFNSMDPSPFRDRDLDADAEEFILSWARELAPDHEIELVIHLQIAPAQDRSADSEQAVHHYFTERLEMKKREFRQLMRRGRTSLSIGLTFLAVCLFASDLAVTTASRPFSTLLSESLVIVGWVAMWRPLEIYLYDWWPLRVERRVLERLSRMKVSLVLPASAGEAPLR